MDIVPGQVIGNCRVFFRPLHPALGTDARIVLPSAAVDATMANAAVSLTDVLDKAL